jgi:hypothetical protein
MPSQNNSSLSSHRRIDAPSRMLAIAPMLEFARRMRIRRPLNPRGSDEQRGSLSVVAAHCARESQVSVRTVWRWYSHFRRGGYAALAHSRSDIGRSRFLRRHPEALHILQALAFDPDLSALGIWKRMRMLGYAPPSYTTIRCLVNVLRDRQRRSK